MYFLCLTNSLGFSLSLWEEDNVIPQDKPVFFLIELYIPRTFNFVRAVCKSENYKFKNFKNSNLRKRRDRTVENKRKRKKNNSVETRIIWVVIKHVS